MSDTSMIGHKLLASLSIANDVSLFYKAKLQDDYFKGDEAELYAFYKSHVSKHGVIPSLTTVVANFGEMPNAAEPYTYYLDIIGERYAFSLYNKALNESAKHLQTKDLKTLAKTLEDALLKVKLTSTKTNVLDFAVEGLQLFDQGTHAALYGQGGIKLGWPTLDNASGGLHGGDILSIIGRPAAGKAQPLDSKVLTSKGFVKMGDLQLGDSLASIDGTASSVTGIYPQGLKQTYIITFVDGRKVECCGEHLWEIYNRHWSSKYKVITTMELIKLLKSSRHTRRLAIRMFSGDFGDATNFVIPPYLMGLLLGDGGFTGFSLTLTTADNEIVDSVNALVGPDYVLNSRGNYGHVLTKSIRQGGSNKYISALRSFGLWGLKSEAKFIPDVYLNADKASRLKLLQGLMDSDGTYGKNGGVSYSTSSKIMAQQVLQLVWSLGGGCSGIKVKKTSHLDSYILHIRFNNPQTSFNLTRKKNGLPTSNQFTGSLRCVIDTVAPCRQVECQCISVSHPSKLYITNDYVVTHNSFCSLWTTFYPYLTQQKTILFVTMEMSLLSVTQRLTGIFAKANMTSIKKGEITTDAQTKVVSIFNDIKGNDHKFWIANGNLKSSVEDIQAMMIQYKPDLVCIDGAYLLKHKNPLLDRYKRVAENIESLKSMSEVHNVPMILSYQLNRDAAKKKGKNEDVGLEDIAYSDAIGQISSVVLGLNQPDSAETCNTRVITGMKGRDGRFPSFSIHWNFDHLDFSEVLADEDTAMTFD